MQTFSSLRGLKYAGPISFILLLLCFFQVLGQSKSISGKITDETGKPVPGVSVVVKSTTVGSISNAEGVYSISALPNATLVFSSVSYEMQEIAVNNRSMIDVALLPSNKLLNEVVVVGYGTQSKRAVTGAVVSINNKQFQDRSFSNVAQSLAGQVAGVNISQAQGAPGSSPFIKIRGVSSITAGTSPLLVVDGVPLENFNLNMINPQDIESIEVLKDASSAAIYGSRGSSGVVLVTTKLGKVGKTNVSANFEYGSQKVTRQIKMMDAQQFIST